MKIYLVFLGSLLSLAAQAQSGNLHTLEKENLRLTHVIDSARVLADTSNFRLIRNDEALTKLQQEYNSIAGDRQLSKDTARLSRMKRQLALLREEKTRLQTRFDDMLVLLDSTLGLQHQVEAKIKAARRKGQNP